MWWREAGIRVPREENESYETLIHLNPRTAALIALGVVSLPSGLNAEEVPNSVLTTLSSTTLSGYVDTSMSWMLGSGEKLYGRSYDQDSNSGAGQNKQDGFNLNVVNLVLEKPLVDGAWSAGYRVQLFMGPDANTLGRVRHSHLRPTSPSKRRMSRCACRSETVWISGSAFGLNCSVTKFRSRTWTQITAARGASSLNRSSIQDC